MNAPLIYIGNGTALPSYPTSDWTPDWRLELFSLFFFFFHRTLLPHRNRFIIALLLMLATVLALPHVGNNQA